MATNQTGAQIVIKAWLPITGSISEQIAKLQMIETAHATSNYADLLKAASVEDVKVEQKTRRVEDAPVMTQPPAEEGDGAGEHGSSVGETEDPPASSATTGETEPSSSDSGPADPAPEPDVSDDAAPEFIKKGKRSAA